MKRVGIVGGLGPASTIDYYKGLIDRCRQAKGDEVYPEIVIDSVNMTQMVGAIKAGALDCVAEMLLASIERLKGAGADFAAIASNSPHIAWDKIKDATPLPLVSIMDAVCDHIEEKRYKRVLILATEFTMRNGLYSRALSERGTGWLLPDDADISALGKIIYPNLENGIVINEDKMKMMHIAEKYIIGYGADSVLLGCTEIPLMIRPGDLSVPEIDSTQIHLDEICGRMLK